MNTLEYRKLGRSGLTVPAMGVGTWSWGDTRWWNYGQSHTKLDIAHAYCTSLDAGFTFFDTAEVYGDGTSEHLLGELYRKDGRPITIASKFAPPLTRFSRMARQRASAHSLLQALDQSLERLGVPCIDLYQIHTPSPVLKVDDLMDVLAEAVQAGKVRAVGVSNYNVAQMRQAHARLARYGIPLASNQVRYSLLHRYPETNGVLDVCRELGVALLAYSPLEQGILTGKYRNPDSSMPANTRRMLSLFLRLDLTGDTKGAHPAWQRLFSTPRVMQREKIEPLFVVLEEIAHAHEKTIAQVALNWLLSKDEWIIPLAGAKNARQVHENAGALGWRLTSEEHARVSQAEMATRKRRRR